MLAARMRSDEFQGMIGVPGMFCDDAHRADADTFFSPRAAKVDNGPKTLAQALESVDLCIASQKHHLPSTTEFLKKY